MISSALNSSALWYHRQCISGLFSREQGCTYQSSRRTRPSEGSRHSRPFRLAVIGSGPAGFYATYRILAKIENAVVDMYEKLPVPFGLVRFGVAPDHPEVKVRGAPHASLFSPCLILNHQVLESELPG